MIIKKIRNSFIQAVEHAVVSEFLLVVFVRCWSLNLEVHAGVSLLRYQTDQAKQFQARVCGFLQLSMSKNCQL